MGSNRLFEDIKVLNGNQSYNIYVAQDTVYFVPIMQGSPRLKKLNKTYNSITVVGRPFGLLGALITLIPAEIFVGPKLRAERQRVIEELRSIEAHQLSTLPGNAAHKREIRFEERKKDRYRIHFPDGHKFVLSGPDARNLQAAIH